MADYEQRVESARRDSRSGREAIHALYERDRMSTEKISQITGYTRQRIGQILRESGIDVAGEGRKRQIATRRKKALEGRNAKKIGRKQASELRAKACEDKARARYIEWRRLWAEGRTALQIAEFEGLPLENVKGAIRRMRQKYGWFPSRRKRKG